MVSDGAGIAGGIKYSVSRYGPGIDNSFKLTRAKSVFNSFEGPLKLLKSPNMRVTHSQLRAFKKDAQKLGFEMKAVTTRKSGVRGKTVYINTETANLWTLLDEYTHLINSKIGRGKFLSKSQKNEHLNLLEEIKRLGSTDKLSFDKNTRFHQLELKNFLKSRTNRPDFFYSIPYMDYSVYLNFEIGGNVIGLK